MVNVIPPALLTWPRIILGICLLLLGACGGGSGKSPGASVSSISSAVESSASTSSSTSSQASSLSSAESSSSGPVTISGKITYDYVPHKNSGIGLNYSAIEARPARGVSVELVGADDTLIAQTVTDTAGAYSLSANPDTQVKIRVRAQLLSSVGPSWNFTVRDNTSNGALYALVGSLASSGSVDSVRDLRAASGWNGTSYSQTRAAAPFAILDTVYQGLMRLEAVANSQNFPPLTLYWSPNNRPADGDLALGEISTSFYDGANAIYLLGAENDDTDEYDPHVILHEWGHYIENQLSRSDTLGGDHPQNARLDLRLAFSEGFATAFAGMLLDDPWYKDASGSAQSTGFVFDMSRTNYTVKGWYAEASNGSVAYNYYAQAVNKNLAVVFNALTSVAYRDTPSVTSIYSFAEALKAQAPAAVATLNSLLTGQNIFGSDAYATGETNDAGRASILPLMPEIGLGTAVSRCSTNAFGTTNTLGVYSFARLSLASAGSYKFTLERASATSTTTNPDIYIYQAGQLVGRGIQSTADLEVVNLNLNAGQYRVEVVDDKNRIDDIGNGDSCFNLTVLKN